MSQVWTTYFVDMKSQGSRDENNYLFSNSFSLAINDVKRKFIKAAQEEKINSTDVSPIFDDKLRFAYEELGERISNYRNVISVEDDDFCAPSEKNLSLVMTAIMRTFLKASLPTPKPMLLPSGVIGVYWKDGTKYLSIDFDDSEEFPWAGTKDGVRFVSGIWKFSDNQALQSFRKLLG